LHVRRHFAVERADLLDRVLERRPVPLELVGRVVVDEHVLARLGGTEEFVPADAAVLRLVVAVTEDPRLAGGLVDDREAATEADVVDDRVATESVLEHGADDSHAKAIPTT